MRPNDKHQSLPFALDLVQWLTYWKQGIPQEQPWQRFLLDATCLAVKMSTLMSRRLRDDPPWERRGWTQDEWRSVEAVGQEALAWFLHNVPSRDLPDQFRKLEKGLECCFRVIALALAELRQAIDNGYLVIPLGPRDDLERAEERP